MQVANEHGTKLSGLKIEMRRALMCCEDAFKSVHPPFIVTYTTNGVHSAGSLHPYGYAFDIRTRDLMHHERSAVIKYLQEHLPSCYQLIIHSTHLHIEYQEVLDANPHL